MEKQIKVKKYDLLGIGSSILCLIHCFITPAFLASQSVLISWGNEWEYMDYLFVFLSLVAVYYASHHAHFSLIGIMLWVFYIMFLASMIFHHEYPALKYLAYASSIVLAVTHIVNITSSDSERKS